MSTVTRAFRVAIVGAGPAGFYAAEHLLNSTCPLVETDMFDRLPTPWGLARAGVAPDHPKIKSVSTQFAEIAAHPRCRFFGNVELGRDITRADLLRRYDAVIYAVGARAERKLGIPGEDLPGSLAASDFVAWYNGHPDAAALEPDLSGSHAVVIGNGNVALDVARMLLLPQSELIKTDIADHALAALANSNIRNVTLLGRRGAAQAAFTTPELREILAIDDLTVECAAEHLALPDGLTPIDQRRIQRNLSLLEKAPAAERASKRLRFEFLRSPVSIQGAERVERIEVGVNRLDSVGGQMQATDSGLRHMLRADLVVRAVGYKGTALPDVPFDAKAGTIPSEQGRVKGAEREYCTGWIKRGPSGIIGTNRSDAVETAEQLLADLANRTTTAASADDIRDWLGEANIEFVDDAGWARIDAYETKLGAPSGRPRVKLVSIEEMLKTARRGSPALQDA